MNKKEVTICGQPIKVMYCAASENGFEDLSGKSFQDFNFTSNKDLLNLSIACIVASYAEEGIDAPISGKDLLYKATPQELANLYKTVLELLKEWYGLNEVIARQLEEEAAQLTPKERASAKKKRKTPTTDTASS